MSLTDYDLERTVNKLHEISGLISIILQLKKYPVEWRQFLISTKNDIDNLHNTLLQKI